MQRFAFIPNRLQIAGRPELDKFPLNILIISYNSDAQGNIFSGYVLYQPDFATFRGGEEEESLFYRNPYDNRFYLRIVFDTKSASYKAEKYQGLERTNVAFGKNWNMFFIQVGMIGLSNGEKCEIKIESEMSLKINTPGFN